VGHRLHGARVRLDGDGQPDKLGRGLLSRPLVAVTIMVTAAAARVTPAIAVASAVTLRRPTTAAASGRTGAKFAFATTSTATSTRTTIGGRTATTTARAAITVTKRTARAVFCLLVRKSAQRLLLAEVRHPLRRETKIGKVNGGRGLGRSVGHAMRENGAMIVAALQGKATSILTSRVVLNFLAR
jgi:hypothetical protein